MKVEILKFTRHQLLTGPMKYTVLSLAVVFAVSAGSCKKSKSNNDPDTTPETEDTLTRYDPVETRPANTTYTPAFEGQTRMYGIRTYTPINTTVLTTGLQSPWGITQLPNGKFLITQKAGTIAIVNSTGNIEQTITGLPPVNSSGQGGLLDIYADDDFANNRIVYWSFSMNEPEGTVTALAKGRLSDDESRMESVQILYKATPAYNGNLHYGSRIVMDNTGCVLLSTGDRSDAGMRHYAQELDNGLGKIIRIRPDGSIPQDNPFVNTSGAHPAVYSYGHRNVQGLAIDRVHNQIYQSELGPRGGDEVNKISGSKNYGWPVITYGIEYSGSPISNGRTQQDGMEQPMYYWDPVISPSGMTFYHTTAVPEWQGSLFIACLNGQHIARLRILDGKVAGEERLLEAEQQRFRDIETGQDGALYAITDAGRLYKIARE